MFDKILQTAQETGAEVMVQLRDFCCDQYKGRVLEIDEDYFSLFHSGPGGGVHWAFKRSDIAYIGLVVELPDLGQTTTCPQEPSEKPHPLMKEEQRNDKNQH